MSCHEFDLINQFFKPLSKNLVEQVGIGDDGAVLNPPSVSTHQLVVVMDTLIEGVHFPLDTPPFYIAWKVLAVNLSDLAAMGARPDFYTLAFTLPAHAPYDKTWFAEFARGLAELNDLFDIHLVGGDTTQGKQLSLTVTAHGWLPKGSAVLRSGAQVGDWVCVSGTIGDGGLGLRAVQNNLNWPAAISKLNQPVPRVALGNFLRGRAHSMIDISDGLLADLNHILQASQVGARIAYPQVPFSADLTTFLQENAVPNKMWPLTAGDDYELCFTLPEAKFAEVAAFAQTTLGLSVTQIGHITQEAGLVVFDELEQPIEVESLGFQHF